MQRSDFLIKLISVILFIAIVLYVGLSFLTAALDPLTTTMAVRASVERSGSAEGWAVREETVLSGGGGAVSVLVDEGEKVASGGALAVKYSGSAALERASQIQDLQQRIDQLERVSSSATARQANALKSVEALSRAVCTGDFSQLGSLTLDAQAYIFDGGTPAEKETELASLRSSLSALQSQERGDTETVLAPASGTFSTVVDGFESISPSELGGLTPSSLSALFSKPGAVSDTALGKLVYGSTWYFAAVMDEADAARVAAAVADSETGEISPSKQVTVEFTRAYKDSLLMNVVSIGEAENGRCAVVFSCRRGLADAIAERALTAEVVFESAVGIRIPEEAVRVEDGVKVVYIVTGLQAERIELDILGEYGGYVIARDGAETGGNLRAGSEIIVKAGELSDGKVVR